MKIAKSHFATLQSDYNNRLKCGSHDFFLVLYIFPRSLVMLVKHSKIKKKKLKFICLVNEYNWFLTSIQKIFTVFFGFGILEETKAKVNCLIIFAEAVNI